MMQSRLLPPATKLRQGNIFRSVCQEFCSQGGGLARGSPGPHPGGRLGVWLGGSPGPHPGGRLGGSPGPHPGGRLGGLAEGVSRRRGEVGGSGQGVSRCRGEVGGSGQGGLQAHTQRGGWGVWSGGSPGPHLGGSPGPGPGGIPACAEADTLHPLHTATAAGGMHSCYKNINAYLCVVILFECWIFVADGWNMTRLTGCNTYQH